MTFSAYASDARVQVVNDSLIVQERWAVIEHPDGRRRAHEMLNGACADDDPVSWVQPAAHPDAVIVDLIGAPQ